MENNILLEEQVREMLNKVLTEETSKVSRQDFSRVQFKLEELQNTIGEAVKDLRKVQDSIQRGLDTVTKSRITQISINLHNTQKLLVILKDKDKPHKRRVYTGSLDEKKKD
jgi:hypothetical protein